jgi:hypothetical protein
MARDPLISSEKWLAAVAAPTAAWTVAEQVPTPLPEGLKRWLAGLRLLERVPFVYLVPDGRLLPPESVRFFHLDRNWTDRLVDGALAAGAIGTSDQDLATEVVRYVRAVLDAESGADDSPVTGFLMRSVVVRRWPRLTVTAYPSSVTLLRRHRVAENILLVLWRGVPTKVELGEPQEGTQYGVESDDQSDLSGADVEVRRDDGSLSGRHVDAPMRRSHRRVLNVHDLAAAIEAELASGGRVDSTRLALTLQQTPFVQVFEGAGHYDRGLGAPAVVVDWARHLETTMTAAIDGADAIRRREG